MGLPKSSLGELFLGFSVNSRDTNWESIVPRSIAVHSGLVEPGAVFFAIPGAKHDGGQFVQEATERGASAVVCAEHASVAECPVPIISVADVRAALAWVSARFYRQPTSDLLCFGVTGTNGKTSVSWIVAQALTALGKPAALCGTLGLGLPEGQGGFTFESSANTTVDPLTLQGFLARAREQKICAASVEVTSQALVQHRTAGVEWDIGLFTNLTRDHLDLHGSMERYGAAKMTFFSDQLARSRKPNRLAVVNIDDPFGIEICRVLAEREPSIRVLEYSTASQAAAARLMKKSGSLDRTVMTCRIDGREIEFEAKLIGDYNVSNLLGAATALVGAGFEPDAVSEALGRVPPVPGRLEVVASGDFSVVVDYAHSPDGLVQAQHSLRPLTAGRLITVFGCGGDRDRGKRPLMGEAVRKLADVAIVTSDNPRSENPEGILDDIEPGLRGTDARKGFAAERVVDRRDAIRKALTLARKGDVVLVAGKGHEDYQEIAGTRFPFSDKEVCRELLSELR
ncbi:MAG: UDP-N-acetylmuramoyl-L-alanyl-D-glutamate--2,6-diaminopimelate ligase [Bdellovibrionota bacterium]